MELWDAYDEHMKLAGFDLKRGETIPQNYFHLVVEVLVRHQDGSYLLMQRAMNKSIQPGKYEASAGGSVLKGETPMDAIKRELFEETGIDVTHFKKIHEVVSKVDQTIFIGFTTIVDMDKTAIKLQLGETMSYMWLNPVDFFAFIETKQFIQRQKHRLYAYLKTIKPTI